MTCRFKCTTGESSARSYVDVNIQLNRDGRMQTAVLPDGFRYAVSYNGFRYHIAGKFGGKTVWLISL